MNVLEKETATILKINVKYSINEFFAGTISYPKGVTVC